MGPLQNVAKEECIKDVCLQMYTIGMQKCRKKFEIKI